MYGQVHQAFKNMGTTAVCVLMLKQEFLVANVGDSRFYIAKKNQVPKVKQITVDQNIKNSDWSQINAIKSIHDEPHLFTF